MAKWEDSSKLRRNKSHKIVRTKTCSKCLGELNVEYNEHDRAVRAECGCGRVWERKTGQGRTEGEVAE